MRTLLYEIRYYLFATLLVIFLIPEKKETPDNQDSKTQLNPISTIRNERNHNSERQTKTQEESAHPLLPKKETNKTESSNEKQSKELYPAPNRY